MHLKTLKTYTVNYIIIWSKFNQIRNPIMLHLLKDHFQSNTSLTQINKLYIWTIKLIEISFKQQFLKQADSIQPKFHGQNLDLLKSTKKLTSMKKWALKPDFHHNKSQEEILNLELTNVNEQCFWQWFLDFQVCPKKTIKQKN